MDLKECRARIDEIDTELVKLLAERLRITEDVAKAKQQSGKPIFDPVREQEKIEQVTQLVDSDLETELKKLYHYIMDVSKEHQKMILGGNG